MSEQYPSDWNSRRKQVYQRDNYTCQNCGAQGDSHGSAELHAHHIVPKSKGGTHKLSNLKTVCARCHRAIHGDNIAPSADQTLGNELILDEDQYPYSALDHIQCVNLAAEITFTRYNEVLESFDELLEYLHASALTSEVDHNLKRQWENTVKDIRASLDHLEDSFEQLLDLSTASFSSECIIAYESIATNIEEDIGDFREYLKLLSRIFEKDEITKKDINRIRASQEELENSQENTSEALEELASNIDSDITEIVHQVDERTKSKANNFSKCPFCGSESKILMPAAGLVQCHSCKAEFIRKSSDWKLMNGPPEWVGEELFYWYWKELGEIDFQTEKEKSTIRRQSNNHSKWYLRIKVTAIALSILGFIISVLTFSIIPAITSIILGFSLWFYYERSVIMDPDI